MEASAVDAAAHMGGVLLCKQASPRPPSAAPYATLEGMTATGAAGCGSSVPEGSGGTGTQAAAGASSSTSAPSSLPGDSVGGAAASRLSQLSSHPISFTADYTSPPPSGTLPPSLGSRPAALLSGSPAQPSGGRPPQQASLPAGWCTGGGEGGRPGGACGGVAARVLYNLGMQHLQLGQWGPARSCLWQAGVGAALGVWGGWEAGEGAEAGSDSSGCSAGAPCCRGEGGLVARMQVQQEGGGGRAEVVVIDARDVAAGGWHAGGSGGGGGQLWQQEPLALLRVAEAAINLYLQQQGGEAAARQQQRQHGSALVPASTHVAGASAPHLPPLPPPTALLEEAVRALAAGLEAVHVQVCGNQGRGTVGPGQRHLVMLQLTVTAGGWCVQVQVGRCGLGTENREKGAGGVQEGLLVRPASQAVQCQKRRECGAEPHQGRAAPRKGSTKEGQCQGG